MGDRQYKVRCTGNDDGTYTLSYGKGSKKLTQIAERYGGGTQKWFIPAGCPACCEADGTPGPALINTLGKIKTAWEVWAKANYGSETDEPQASGDVGLDRVVVSSSEPEAESPVVESKTVVALTGEKKTISYNAEGSRAKREDDDETLPVIAPNARGEKVAELKGYEVCVHVPSRRFPYLDGFAMFDNATSQQVGWSKHKDDAMKSLNQSAF